MTDNRIQEVIDAYVPVSWPDPKAKEPRYMACYIEVPLCLAEGSTPEGAVADLEAMILTYLKAVVDAGGKLPIPRSHRQSRKQDLQVQIVGMVAGGPYNEYETAGAFDSVRYGDSHLVEA
jgi:predicted RNase H-like HicB family nuclease